MEGNELKIEGVGRGMVRSRHYKAERSRQMELDKKAWNMVRLYVRLERADLKSRL